MFELGYHSIISKTKEVHSAFLGFGNTLYFQNIYIEVKQTFNKGD